MKPGLLGSALETPASFQLFGHLGGWDEILIVAAPLLIIAGLLYIANRRVDAKLAERSDTESQSPS